MLKYYSTYSKNKGINNKNATAEACQNGSSTRAETIIQRTKRKIIISMQTGLSWNSDAIQFDQFLKTISEPLNMNLLMEKGSTLREQKKSLMSQSKLLETFASLIETGMSSQTPPMTS
jgi:hypothetical protein